MDSWIVALRGGSDALVEGRALFGSPVAAVADAEVYAFEAASAEAAARSLLVAAGALGEATGAAGLDGANSASLREAVLAATLAGAPGEFLVCGDARAHLAELVIYVRPRRRRGWRIPVPCLAFAPECPSRAVSVAAAATLPSRPALVHRDAEIDALCTAIAPERVIVLRAAPGMGGSRVLSEAATKMNAALIRLPVESLGDDGAIDRALRSLPVEGSAWIVVDPVLATTVPSREALAAVLAHAPGASLVVRTFPDAVLSWSDPDAEVEVGPLAPTECRDLVVALLGDAEPSMVARLARRGAGGARAVVDAVRLAVQQGEVVRDGRTGFWRWQSRRVLRMGVKPARGEVTSAPRLGALASAERRSLQAAIHLGEGVEHHALGALLRALFGPPDAVDTLRAHGLVDVEDGRVTFSAALAEWLPADPALSARIDGLRARGVTDLLAAASQAAAPEAARALALAARRALAAQDLAAAVRLCVAAGEMQSGPYGTEIQRTRADVTQALGVVVTITPRDAAPRSAPRKLDPTALHEAAETLADRGDESGALRMRALAALALGDTHAALRLADAPVTVRDHLVRALAQAQDGQAAPATRNAVSALSLARRAGDASGETAALTLLGALYTALGRDAEAHALTGAARRVGVGAVVTSGEAGSSLPPGSHG